MDEGEVAPDKDPHAERAEYADRQHVGTQSRALQTNQCVSFVTLYFRSEFTSARDSEQGMANDLNDDENDNYADERYNLRGLDVSRRIRQGERKVGSKRGAKAGKQEPQALFAESDTHN